MRYEVTTLDTSADGMERLRNQDEFILLAYGDASTHYSDLRGDWTQDLQSCSRPDGFDYDAATTAIAEWVESNQSYVEAELKLVGLSPKDAAEKALETLELVNADCHPKWREMLAVLEEVLNDDENGSATFRLYIRDTEGGDVN